jgi:hypothetical protein
MLENFHLQATMYIHWIKIYCNFFCRCYFTDAWLSRCKHLKGNRPLLGEKFRSDDTIHTIIRKNLSKAKLHAKLHLFHDPTIHVRGGIYRALAFIFYIKWLFYPWPNYLQPFIYVRAKWSFSSNSVFFFAYDPLFLQ